MVRSLGRRWETLVLMGEIRRRNFQRQQQRKSRNSADACGIHSAGIIPYLVRPIYCAQPRNPPDTLFARSCKSFLPFQRSDEHLPACRTFPKHFLFFKHPRPFIGWCRHFRASPLSLPLFPTSSHTFIGLSTRPWHHSSLPLDGF